MERGTWELTLFILEIEAIVECFWVVGSMSDHAGEVTSKTLGFEACSSDEVTSCLYFCIFRLGTGLSKRLCKSFGGTLDSATRLSYFSASCFGKGLW